MKGLENGETRIDLDVYKGILRRLVRTYQYFNQNEKPDKVVIPHLLEIDGVPVVMEEPKEEYIATRSRKANTTKLDGGNQDSHILDNQETDE